MTLFAFGMPGPMEICIVLGVALLLLGPSQLPKAMRSLGQAVPMFKRGMVEANKEVAEIEKATRELADSAKGAVSAVGESVAGVKDSVESTTKTA